MKNIYFVQPSNEMGGQIYLPYSAGTLAAYSFQFEEIKSNYALKEIIFRKEEPTAVADRMDEPFFVGFSCYLWNIEYNLHLAQLIKNRFPSCVIAFGGPQIPDDRTYLEEYAFIDLLMHGEGEITFCSVLRSLLTNGDLSAVDNISFRRGGEIVKTPRVFCKKTESFPSPYTGGFFDAIVNDPANSRLSFETVLETNRGCPYHCVYCCWAGTQENFRLFPMERVKGDLLWMAQHKITYCICADSNFGILPRDREIAEYLVKLKKEYGYPKKFETTSARNKDEFVFEINQLLESEDLNCGISIALQSTSPVVLENIGRSNINFESFREQIKRYADCGMSTYTDLILALPGETYQSFCRAVFDILEAEQHTSINIHPCEVLPNTVLYDAAYRKKFGIQTVCSKPWPEHSRKDCAEECASRSEIIVATDTMTKAEWVSAMKVSTMVQSFHSFGLLRCIAIYLRREKDLPYYDFYMRFFHAVEQSDGTVKSVLDYATASLTEFLAGKSGIMFFDSRFSDSFLRIKEALFLCAAYDLNAFYDDAKGIIKKEFAPLAEEPLVDELFAYQKAIINLPNKPETIRTFSRNWNEYFSTFRKDGYTPLEPGEFTYLFEPGNCSDWYDYTKRNIWYGKRTNKMILKEITRVNKHGT